MNDEQRLQVITEMLILVRDNLFQGMSKSIQKLQARSINETLGLQNFTTSFLPVQPERANAFDRAMFEADEDLQMLIDRDMGDN